MAKSTLMVPVLVDLIWMGICADLELVGIEILLLKETMLEVGEGWG